MGASILPVLQVCDFFSGSQYCLGVTVMWMLHFDQTMKLMVIMFLVLLIQQLMTLLMNVFEYVLDYDITNVKILIEN